MRLQLWQALTPVLVATVLLTSSATAASPQDTLVGSGQFSIDFSLYHFTVSAHSGPSGENPYGQVQLVWKGMKGQGTVSCLSVLGNQARVIARLDERFPPHEGLTYSDFYLSVTDNSAPGASAEDLITPGIISGDGAVPPPITNCLSQGGFFPIEQGDFVITDAMP